MQLISSIVLIIFRTKKGIDLFSKWTNKSFIYFRNDSSFNFMLFFVVFFFQIVLTIVYALGIPSFGTWYVLSSFLIISDRIVKFYIILEINKPCFCDKQVISGVFKLYVASERFFWRNLVCWNLLFLSIFMKRRMRQATKIIA